jgi:hypothetical protein
MIAMILDFVYLLSFQLCEAVILTAVWPWPISARCDGRSPDMSRPLVVAVSMALRKVLDGIEGWKGRGRIGITHPNVRRLSGPIHMEYTADA